MINKGGVEVIRGHKKKCKGIRDSLHFLSFDWSSKGLNNRLYTQELNAILTDCITIVKSR